MDADYPDDIVLLINISAEAEHLLHYQENSVGGIGLHVNADKTKYICFNQNQNGDIFTLKGCSLKRNEQVQILRKPRLIYGKQHQYVTSEDIDRLSVIWTSDLSDKIKRNFFHDVNVSILQCGCTTWKLTKHIKETLDGTIPQGCFGLYWWNPGSNISQNLQLYNHLPPSLKSSKPVEEDMQDTAGEVRTKS